MPEHTETVAAEAVLYVHDGGVATITLNRPERRNALSHDVTEGLAAALERAGNDPAVRAVVVTGAGRGFCAGGDISVFAAGVTPEQARDYIIANYKPLLGQFQTLRKPIIGAINGVAAGAGAALALACDLRIMADNASLLYAFINLGLAPDAGASWLLARQVGYSRALEIAIEGDRISAERCLALGLTNRIAPADRLLEEAHAWAARLAARPTLAIGLTKQTLQKALLTDLPESIAHEANLQMQTLASEDHREGVRAFLEKRPPAFEGR